MGWQRLRARVRRGRPRSCSPARPAFWAASWRRPCSARRRRVCTAWCAASKSARRASAWTCCAAGWTPIPPGWLLVEGDLADPNLATAPALAYQIDTVVHGAAAVNLFAPYEALRAANVLAARAVLEFAARGAPKSVHFVSTVGVFLSPRYRGQTIPEDADVGGAEGLRNGFAQSKWVADQMMARARARGLAVTIYRPAFVGWHARTGRAGEHDLVALLLASSLAAGCAPRLDLQINATPVDHVAETVARMVSLPSARRRRWRDLPPDQPRRGPLRRPGRRWRACRWSSSEQWQAAVTSQAPRYAELAALVRRAQDDPGSGSVELRRRARLQLRRQPTATRAGCRLPVAAAAGRGVPGAVHRGAARGREAGAAGAGADRLDRARAARTRPGSGRGCWREKRR